MHTLENTEKFISRFHFEAGIIILYMINHLVVYLFRSTCITGSSILPEYFIELPIRLNPNLLYQVWIVIRIWQVAVNYIYLLLHGIKF